MFNGLKYYKTLAFLAGVLFFLADAGKTFAQDISISHDLVERKVAMFGTDGKLFENPYINIAGTPFLFDTWKYGILEINEKDVFSNVQLRLDLLGQQVHLKKTDGNEVIINPGAVKKITLFDSTGTVPALYFFECGFPSIDNQNANNFYQILCRGKIEFLKSQRKAVKEEKDSFSGEIKKEFASYEDYYFFDKNKLQRLKRDKTSILNMMKDKNDNIESFVQANKISFKSIDDIKKLVDYYNSLN